jgi:hypothetical protein
MKPIYTTQSPTGDPELYIIDALLDDAITRLDAIGRFDVSAHVDLALHQLRGTRNASREHHEDIPE